MSLREVARQLSLLILLLIVSSTECRVGKNAARNGTLEPLRVPEVNVPKRSSLEAKCDEQVKILMNSMEKREQWALEMIDASSKIPLGTFKGSNKDLGMYDQCVAINVTLGNETIRGQHCMYTLDVNLNGTKLFFSPVLSVCLPATCDSDQVKEKMQRQIDSASDFLGGKKLKVTKATCSEVDTKPWELGTVITLGVFGTLLAFLLICTAFDVLSRLNSINSNFVNTLSQFSLILNGQRILSTAVPKNNVPVITGIRFYSMCWIILGHRSFIFDFGSIFNYSEKAEWEHSWKSILIFLSANSVDTFLVMSGVLTSYLFLKEMSRGRKFNLFEYFFHRYMRLTPAYASLLAIGIFLAPKMGSGPMWGAISTHSEHCKGNWWPMLLYVHNYVYDRGPTCLTHTWYLTVDMQLFWLSPLIIYPLHKKPKLGLIILCAAIAASVITPGVIQAINKYDMKFLATETADHAMFLNLYIVTHTRAGPWLVGVLLGYLLATDQRVPAPRLRKLGWILTILAFVYTIFMYRIFQREDYQSNIYWETFNAAVSRHIWAFGVCWVIYISTLGHGGFVSKILSSPMFLPFSRISYSIYLISYLVQLMETKSSRAPLYLTEYLVIKIFISDLIINTIIGFFFSLVFETPFLVLEKLILAKIDPINQSKTVSNNEIEKFQREDNNKNEIIQKDCEK